MTSTNFLLETKSLSKQFEDRLLLYKQDLNILPNSINFLTGPNGSGKSTLLKMLAGLEPTTSGHITKNINSIFYLGELCGLYSKLSVIENINFFLNKLDSESINLSLNTWQLDSVANKTIKALSKGMQFRVSLLISFLLKNTLVLMDEPTAYLDSVGVEIFTRELYSSNNLNTYIIATHDLIRINAGNSKIIELEL